MNVNTAWLIEEKIKTRTLFMYMLLSEGCERAESAWAGLSKHIITRVYSLKRYNTILFNWRNLPQVYPEYLTFFKNICIIFIANMEAANKSLSMTLNRKNVI